MDNKIQSNSNWPNTSKELKLVLLLLEKLEQILSIINWPEKVFYKYNNLKEITFNKCNLPFTPLTKRQSSWGNVSTPTNTQLSTPMLNNTNTNTNNSSMNSEWSTLSQQQNTSNSAHSSNWGWIEKLKVNNNRKNMLIELWFEWNEKQKIENVRLCRGQVIKDYQNYHKQLNKISTLSMTNTNTNANKSINGTGYIDQDFDFKLDENKVNEYIKKLDSIFITSTIALQSLNSSSSSNFKQQESDFDNIIQNYNNKIYEIKALHEKEIDEYKRKFDELWIKYNPNIEKELTNVKCLIEEINEIISPIYDKYSKKKISNFDKENLEQFEYSNWINKINFLMCFIEQLYKDNKHWFDTFKEVDTEKDQLEKELNLPFVSEVIKKNEIMNNIYQCLGNCSTQDDALWSKEISAEIDGWLVRLTSALDSK